MKEFKINFLMVSIKHFLLGIVMIYLHIILIESIGSQKLADYYFVTNFIFLILPLSSLGLYAIIFREVGKFSHLHLKALAPLISLAPVVISISGCSSIIFMNFFLSEHEILYEILILIFLNTYAMYATAIFLGMQWRILYFTFEISGPCLLLLFVFTYSPQSLEDILQWVIYITAARVFIASNIIIIISTKNDMPIENIFEIREIPGSIMVNFSSASFPRFIPIICEPVLPFQYFNIMMVFWPFYEKLLLIAQLFNTSIFRLHALSLSQKIYNRRVILLAQVAIWVLAQSLALPLQKFLGIYEGINEVAAVNIFLVTCFCFWSLRSLAQNKLFAENHINEILHNTLILVVASTISAVIMHYYLPLGLFMLLYAVVNSSWRLWQSS